MFYDFSKSLAVQILPYNLSENRKWIMGLHKGILF